MVAEPPVRRRPLIVTPALLPPLFLFSWAVIALDNALFLFFPHRFDPDDSANVGFMGKLMLVMSLKFAALMAVMAAAAIVGALAGFAVAAATGGAETAAYVVGMSVGLVVLVVADVVLTYCVALAFDAFDPGRDVPA